MTVRYDDTRGNTGTTTLEQATLLSSSSSATSSSGANNADIPNGINVDGKKLIVTSAFNGDLWMSANRNYSNENIVVIDASKNSNNMILTGNSKSNSIKSGNGQNSIWGGGQGDNTLTGGTARNQFWYTGGSKDVVTNFSAGAADNSDVVAKFF